MVYGLGFRVDGHGHGHGQGLGFRFCPNPKQSDPCRQFRNAPFLVPDHRTRRQEAKPTAQ